MEFFLLSLAIITFLGWAGAGILVLHGTRQIRLLKDLPPADQAKCPSLSIIIPARNEERHVEPALLSLLHQDYPNLEIIVLNDRSTDKSRSAS